MNFYQKSILFAFITAAAYYFASALAIMLLWNFLAAYFEWQAITYPVSLVITALLSVIGNFFKSSATSNK